MALGLWDFEGEWRVARRIDHAVGPQARFAGAARFSRDGTGLLYEETGTLSIEGRGAVQAERRLLWREGADGRMAVLFGDGRAFHEIDPGEAAPRGRHLCGDDVYEVAYDFAAWPDWSSVWRARGPAKDYRMTTRYHRGGDPGRDPDLSARTPTGAG